MRFLWVACLAACAPVYRGVPDARPSPTASQQLISEAYAAADLVVLGTPDTMVAEPMLAASLQVGAQDAWFNIRISVEAVAKGKLGLAKAMDYETLPVYMTPPRPFKLGSHQIIVQVASRWQTAPVIVGERAVYFLKKCYRCVEMPARTQYRTFASPVFAILAISPDLWPEVPRGR